MKATEILKNEHRVIEQMLDCLEKIETEARNTEQFDRISASHAIDFFSNFADRCHHGKEEEILFPMLEARGLPRQFGPTSVMLLEHVQGRGYLKGMAAAINQDLPRTFAEHARRYIDLMREHIRKEDCCLFAMADRLLGDEDAHDLADQFDRFEHEDMGEGVHADYVRMADHLADRFGVAHRHAVVSCGCAGSSRTPVGASD